MAVSGLHVVAGTWRRRVAVSFGVFLAAMAVFALTSIVLVEPRPSVPEGHAEMASTAPPASTPTVERAGALIELGASMRPTRLAPQPPMASAPSDSVEYEMELAHGKRGGAPHRAARHPGLDEDLPAPSAAPDVPAPSPTAPPEPPAQPTAAAPTPTAPPIKFASFNKPQSLYVYETQTIQAILSATKSQPGDPNFVNLQGPVTSTGPIALRTYVTAKLIASKDLLQVDPPSQGLRIVGDKDIVFLWDIKPLKTGTIPITLELYSQDGGQQDAPLDVFKVMHDSWTVEARGINRFDYWIDQVKPLQAEIWALCSAIASVMTFFGLKFARDRSPESPSPTKSYSNSKCPSPGLTWRSERRFRGAVLSR